MDVLKLKEAGVSLGYEGDDLKTFVVEQKKIARQERLAEREALKAREERDALNAREERKASKEEREALKAREEREALKEREERERGSEKSVQVSVN